MAIDVEKEAIKTTLRIRDIRNMEDDDARRIESLIAELLRKHVAEAKREQMEDDCKAVREWCNQCDREGVAGVDGKGDPYECEYCGRPMAAIKEAFAATEQRDAAKDDARQRFDHAAVELRQYLGMGTLDMAAKFGPDFDPDEYAKGLAESFDSAARELGLDGAA